jgi:PAS domain-containing protein
MELHTNPYIIWQLIPALITLWLGIYVQSRPRKKPESNVFSLLLLAGSFWSLANAIQLASPNYSWQLFWHNAAFLAIAIIPTAWFLFAVKFTGYFRTQIEKVRALFLVIPGLTYVAILTNGYHRLFFSSFKTISINGFANLTGAGGILFYIHTYYSYALLFLGMLFLGIALVTNFKSYGSQAYGLILGVFTPLIGNVLYIFGGLPPGFPDPTPIAFTITGITFAWAIFAGRMLDVVPIAHESVVETLTSGIVVLDLENKILNINPAAVDILGLPSTNLLDRPLPKLLEHHHAQAKERL